MIVYDPKTGAHSANPSCQRLVGRAVPAIEMAVQAVETLTFCYRTNQLKFVLKIPLRKCLS